MIISKENNAFVISGIFDGTLRNGKVCFPMNTTALVIDGRDIVRFIDAVSQDELFATPLRTLVYDGEFVTRETLFEDFDAVSMAAGGGPGPAPEPELNWFKITNLTNEDGKIKLYKKESVDYTLKFKVSSDGVNWTDVETTNRVTEFDLPPNGYVLINGKTNNVFNTYNNYYSFVCTVNWKVSGDLSTLVSDYVNSSYTFLRLFHPNAYTLLERKLIDASELVLPWEAVSYHCFQEMFGECSNLITAPDLPATKLAPYCYSFMFNRCTSLTTAPALPATTLAENCYSSMFYGCSSLTTAPALPATTLAEYCYSSMFSGCTSLTTAPDLPATTLAINCYQYMFNGCSSLTSAPTLPATSLQQYCYASMFSRCTSLTTAPALPATSLANFCYRSMFDGCSSLRSAPALPATNLGWSCYDSMFNLCTSLTTAPTLPATTLAYGCYRSMFWGCSSLTTAPALPATSLQQYCYRSMFWGCSSLTTAPALPATTLANNCYESMFSGCTSLNYINCLATDISATNACALWTQNVSPTGTFECAGGMSATWPTGNSGIPTGWTVVDPSVSQTVSFTIQGYEDVGCRPDGIEGTSLTKTVNGVSEVFSFPVTGTLDFTVANDASTTPITFTQEMGACCARFVTITPSDIVENYSGVYSMSEGTTDEECECINTGGTWDPDTQTCTYPEPPEPDPCIDDPQCNCETYQGGTWDPENNECVFE